MFTSAFKPEFTSDTLQSVISSLQTSVASLTLQVQELSDEVKR